MSIEGKLKVVLGLEHTDADPLTNPREELPTITNAVSSGADEGQMDLLWHQQFTDIDSTGTTLDLTNNSLKDSFGNSMNFSEVRMICVVASADNGANKNIIVGNSAEPLLGWVIAGAHRVQVPPGGVFYTYTPAAGTFDVDTNANDKLKIAASSGTLTCDVYIGGVSN